MDQTEDYNTPTESRGWQVVLIALFVLATAFGAYKVAVVLRTGTFGASLYDGLTRLGEDYETMAGTTAEKAGIKREDQLVSIDDLVLLSDECKERALTIEELKSFHELMEIGATRTVTACRINPPDSPKPGPEFITRELEIVGQPLLTRVRVVMDFIHFMIVGLIIILYLAKKVSTLPARLACLNALIMVFIFFEWFFTYSIFLTAISSLQWAVFPLWIYILLIWPSPHPIKRKIPSITIILYVFGVILIAASAYIRLKMGHHFHANLSSPIVVCLLIFILVLAVQQFRMADFPKRQQFKWLFFVVIIIAIPTWVIKFSWLSLYTSVPDPSELLHGITFYVVHVKFLIDTIIGPAFAVTAVMAFSNYRLDLAQTALTKSLKYIVMAMLLGFTMLLAAGCLAYSAQEYAAIKEPWAIIGITILAVVLVYPAQRYLGGRLDRWFRKRILDLQEFKDKVDEVILSEAEPGKLITHVVEKLQAILDSATAFVFLRAGEGGEGWRLAAFVKLSSSETERLATGPPEELTRYLDEKPEPTSKIRLLSRTRLGMEQELRTDLVEVIESIQTDAVVPVISRGCMKGIMCLGPKPGKGIYTAEELTLLGQIAAKVGMGLQSALAYEMMEDKVEARTRELKEAHEDMERLTDSMKYYLSPQLVDALASHEDKKILAGSRRVKLTIFFSDIRGFTETTDRMEPEDMTEMLNHYLDEMSEIALKHGGTIDKYIGDAVMVFFGAPTATEDRDHALRCVRMAWEMQERMKELSREWEQKGIATPLAIRIGINTGYAAVGSFGSRKRLDYTAIGGQVNLASRLESQCEPGKILLSFSTNALVQDEFETKSKGEITVKGLHHPVDTFEVIGPRQT